MFHNEFPISWHYIYEFKITFEEKLIKFSDGEVESVGWFTKNEIIGKIKKDENITYDSISVFNFYLDYLDSQKNK